MATRSGFTTIELMVVVAILSVLAAFAIPQYSEYVGTSKRNAALNNFNTAIVIIKAEMAKSNSEAAMASDVVGMLNNQGRNKNPYNPDEDSYFFGGPGSIGQVVLSKNDFSAIVAGFTVDVTLRYIDESSLEATKSRTLTAD